jgi:hypothetical protein
MIKNRIHVLIDRQPEIREQARQWTDLFGQAGLAWLQAVELSVAERQLLDSELLCLKRFGRESGRATGSCAGSASGTSA